MADGEISAMRKPRHAWWAASLGEFMLQEDERIVERLALRLVEAHPLNRANQLHAWRQQITIFRAGLHNLPPNWRLLLEYPLLRLGKRLDAIIVSDRGIFVIEFKIGAITFDKSGHVQVEDYALDLQDFHAASRHQLIIPILVATEAPLAATSWPLVWHGVVPVFEASAATLSALLRDIIRNAPAQTIVIEDWETAPYRPVPTIVEAATMLYRKNGVADIAASRADVSNLTRTTKAIIQVVQRAAVSGGYHIVFVTGIPGAGKTLCGLNAVFGADTGAAFLTGNLPLVHVLREALARDAAQAGGSIRQARQKTESAIQGLTGFVRDNLAETAPPHEHVVVFDEAQRAWDANYGARKFQLRDSEAGLFLDIMRRHPDYAVIIALVGNGQEINTGEAGLGEWGRALALRPDWQVSAAPTVLTTIEPRQRLFEQRPETILIDNALHLDVPVRAIHSAAGASWVDALLRGDACTAAQQAETAGLPFFITRSLAAMRSGLRIRARGARRAGLVCSTGARRLVADGIWPDFPHLENDAIANWFLNRWPDVRASDALEIPATQFACQGLELDQVGLCWGGDLVWQNGWRIRKFVGTKWQNTQGQDAKDYRINTYRVLLTRARYDTIIWIPTGNPADETRDPTLFDQTVRFFLDCGATMLEETATSAPEKSQNELF